MTPVVVGVDLGGTLLKTAVLHGDRMLDRGSVPSDAAHGAAVALDRLLDAAAALCARHRAVAVGIGLPGAVDTGRGMLAGPTPHLAGGESLAVRERAAERLGLPIAVDNDANCAARAEALLGAARGARTALVVTVGTGIGCGIVHEGRVLAGAHGGAGEIGHWPIGSGELSCRCGVPCCAEPEMSAEGLARLCTARDLPWRDAEALFAAVKDDDRARALVERFANRLGVTLAIAAQLVDADRVVLGGGLTLASGFPLDEVRSAAAGHLQLWRRAVGLDIVPATLGAHAGAIGAALLAREAAEPSAAARVSRS